MLINLNGSLVAKEKAVLSVFDHGVLYGDGVFERIRAYNGQGLLCLRGPCRAPLRFGQGCILLTPPPA